MDVQFGQPLAFDPVNFLGLVARTQLAADRAGAEADGELLADFAVVVADDVAGGWCRYRPSQ